jgi:uncharacterized membrane protein (DUF373 family)
MEKHIINVMKQLSRWIIVALIVALVISMFFGTADFIYENVFKSIVSRDPYPLLIKTEELYAIFSMILIIIVGYELFKSLYIILHSNQMPVKSITKVAAIAMANKVITLNLKEIEPIELFGISTIIIAIGLSYFLFHKDSEIKE